MARSGRNGKESVKEPVTVIGTGITIVVMTRMRMIVTTNPMRGAIMTRMKAPVVGMKKNQMKPMRKEQSWSQLLEN